ncbi:hypothetical protein HDU98_007418 [Podochytrium sp. JEL0797]|nr:hypothetical protein HDU98_007418 [Podochytrium sp. JEL0797]
MLGQRPVSHLAIVDSGTTLIVVDTATLQQITDYLFNSTPSIQYQQTSGGFEVSCEAIEAFPDIVFYIGDGVPFAISASDYILPVSPPVCMLGIQTLASAAEEPIQWILGDVFMKRYYSVFDLAHRQVGLARATDGMTVGNGTMLTPAGLATGGGEGERRPPQQSSGSCVWGVCLGIMVAMSVAF